MLGSFGTSNWVVYGSGSDEWKGGLLSVTDGPEEWIEVEYKDMEASCDELPVKCDIFEDLRSSGVVFCFFDVIAYVFTLAWMLKVASIILQKQFLERVSAIIWPIVGLGFHIMAQILWSGVSKAKISGSCDDIYSDEICASTGPALVLFVTCIYILTFIFFLLFHIKRFKEEPVEDDNKN